MFVVFEGIDGSGKTTISNRVAEGLRRAGLDVAHVREGGKFASDVTQRIRELGRDARNLPMTPRAELMLFIARDLQLLEEAIRPELTRRDVVVADRYLYTAEVLAAYGRGLPPADVDAVIHAAAGGFEPELVILIDVDPHVARARKRVGRLLSPENKPSSRKGLTGVGLQHRMRDGYRRLAASDPGRWLVVDNSEDDLDLIVEELIVVVRDVSARGASAALEDARRRRADRGMPRNTEARSPVTARTALYEWISRRATREPQLAAYFLGGLTGSLWDAERLRLAKRAPVVTAAGLRGLTDEVSWSLRAELAEQAPGEIARSLVGLAADDPRAWKLREQLVPVVPMEVAASLDSRDDEQSWTFRERLWTRAPERVVASLKRLGNGIAWTLRERFLAERGGEAALERYEVADPLASSLTGLGDERAWELRKRAFANAPVPALQSLAGLVDDERAWKWRTKYIDRAAKVVMASLDAIDDPRAFQLREAVCLRVKEALDSMLGLDGAGAWRIRELCADIWPSTTVKSLGLLARTARGEELTARILARHPSHPTLWKHTVRLADVETPPREVRSAR
jgi:dTMP kinase